MKTITILSLLVCLVGCRVSHSGNEDQTKKSVTAADGVITTKVTELDRDKDGRAASRMETFYRGNAKILMVYSRADTNGVMRVSARTYLVNGEIVLSDGDDDGDGVFETIIATHPETKELEVFTRALSGE